MTVHALAIIDSNTEVYCLHVPGGTFQDEGVWETDNNYTVVHILDEVVDHVAFMRTQYYKDGAWKTREWKSDYYKWKGSSEEWEFDSDKFWTDVRTDRLSRLVQSDWTQLPDSPLSDSKKAEWTEYRSALRGVPQTNSGTTKLDEIVWPDKPS
jgi:hypothetical protein